MPKKDIPPTGIIAPDGTITECDYAEHDWTIMQVLGLDIDHAGRYYLRFSIVSRRPFNLFYMKRITKKQVNFIWDYCQAYDVEYPKDEIDTLTCD